MLSGMKALYWQPALDELGGIVEDEHDVHQAFTIILMTRKGEVPHRPEFGTDLWRHLDQPTPTAIPAIVREVFTALTRWEPRARIKSVIPNLVLDERERQRGARVKLGIHWQWAGTDLAVSSEVLL